jgi:hypothetical protein
MVASRRRGGRCLAPPGGVEVLAYLGAAANEIAPAQSVTPRPSAAPAIAPRCLCRARSRVPRRAASVHPRAAAARACPWPDTPRGHADPTEAVPPGRSAGGYGIRRISRYRATPAPPPQRRNRRRFAGPLWRECSEVLSTVASRLMRTSCTGSPMLPRYVV